MPGQGNIPVNEVRVERCSEEDVTLLTDELLQFARDNFDNVSMSVLTKDSARDFIKDCLPLSSFNFHLQSVQTTFISWERSDPRVSKEILKCNVLPNPASNCFSIQSTKVEADESRRLLIGFTDVVGLGISEDLIVMDVKSIPTMERRVHASKQNSTTAETNTKWTEQSFQANETPPHRVKLGLVRGRQPADLQEQLMNIPQLKKAIEGGLVDVYPGAQLQEEYKPEERYPVLKDPALVRAGQMACLSLVGTLPSTNKADYIIRMYSSIESKFNSLLRERIQRRLAGTTR